jgi:hypothetical protein
MDKCKADRLKETIRLLKELERVGITKYHVGYNEIKALMTKWVQDGEKAAAEIELPRQGRVADVSLPKRADRAASINLRVVVKHEDDP